MRDFLFVRKKKQKRKGAVFRVRPLHPENSATPSGVVCCSGVLPPPVSGGKKRGREGARSDVSPLDEERRVVGVCVGAEKGMRECADKAGVLLMTVSAPSRGGLPPVSGGNREREGGVRAQGEVLLMNGRASSEGALGLKRGGEVRGQSGGYFESGGAPSGRGVWVGAVSGILVKGGDRRARRFLFTLRRGVV